MSSARWPETQSVKIFLACSPSSIPSDGCHSSSRPKSTIRLFASGILGAEAVDQVSVLAEGLVRGSRAYAVDPVPVGGLVSLAKLLKDPDISRALSFYATVTKSIGQQLAADQPTRQR